MKKGTLLLVDDDQGLQLVMTQYLEDDGYTIHARSNVQGALEAVSERDIDVVLLDLGLPDGEGLSLIPQIKAKKDLSIIVVSGKTDTTEKILCLEMGADDYITKPFEMRELSARLKAVTRRAEPATPNQSDDTEQKEEMTIFGDGWVLNRSQYQLFTKDNVSAELTTGEFKMLDALVSAPQRTLSREKLFDMTRDGGSYDVYDRAIDIQIARLRKKLANDSVESEDMIKTVRGVGYMFIGKIKA